MSQVKEAITNRRLLFSHIIIFATVILATLVVSIHLVVKQHVISTLESNTNAWATSIAQTSSVYLQQKNSDSHEQLQEKLKQIITAPFINYIQIYKKNALAKKDSTKQAITEKFNYYAGYKKSLYFPVITDKASQIDKFTEIQYQQNYLELIIKIESNQQTIGYLYIQSSTKEMDNFIEKITLTALTLFIFGLIFTAFLSFILQKKINRPITTMVESIKIMSQSNNYNARIANLPIVELDILARYINVLLNNIQRFIIKQEDAHQLAIQQNDKLSEKVNARSTALKESNQELLETLDKLHQFQGRLVENEKMASLGDMVAGIAHEVNTPIGLGVTASTLMLDRLNEIKQAFEDKTLKSSQLKRFLVQGEENINIIYRNLDRAAKLITSFKKVAVDQSSAETCQFNVKELIDEVLLTLQAKITAKNITVIVDCSETLIVESKPGSINQILINLIINSIIHAFEKRSQGIIEINIIYFSHQLNINYQDDGVGIDKSIKNKVFEPFITTKRGIGGSGLGLHLVYNLVTQGLNGHIDFQSSSETGTQFDITFPVTLEQE